MPASAGTDDKRTVLLPVAVGPGLRRDDENRERHVWIRPRVRAARHQLEPSLAPIRGPVGRVATLLGEQK
jgi:hypothetical protein